MVRRGYREPSPVLQTQMERVQARHESSHLAVQHAREERLKDFVEKWNKAESEYKAKRKRAAKKHPYSTSLAKALLAKQPDWAEGEECDVDVLRVAEALEELGLRLVKR